MDKGGEQTIRGIVRCVPIAGEVQISVATTQVVATLVQMVPDWLSWALDIGCIRNRVQQGFFEVACTKSVSQ